MNNYKQCYICGDSISIGTTCDNCWQKELARKKEREYRPKLIPRSFKIEQNINEHTYYVEFDDNSKKWAVMLVSGTTKEYLAGKGIISRCYSDIVFDTPELALEAWTKWYSPKDNISEWANGLLYELNVKRANEY